MNMDSVAVEVYLGLGSNLGNPIANLKSACTAISQIDGVQLLALSPFYSSKPIGPQDQPDYVNAAIRLSTHLSAQQLLEQLQAIENQHGRIRTVRWGARTLDLDILLYGDSQVHDSQLTIPHIEMSKRSFVLYPLADIAPAGLMIPGLGTTLAALVAACPAEGLEKIPL